MIFCRHCDDYCHSIKDPDKRYICCGNCGKVDTVISDDPIFYMDNRGQGAEEAAAVKEAAVEESLCDTQNSDVESTITPREVKATVQRNAHTMGIRGDKSSTIASEELNDSVLSKDPDGENCEGDVDPESLSDINDVGWYLHNEEETQCKNSIWEEMNREYLQEQAAKEALAARGVVQEAKKKQRRNEGVKSSKPSETPAEATYNMLKKKYINKEEGRSDEYTSFVMAKVWDFENFIPSELPKYVKK